MPSKVSIVVPIYKVEKYLRRCVDSIINQTYRNLEIILVDDGSPDKCGQIIDEYKEKDSRIISLHKKNGGLSDARNYGMKYVTGEYIFFLDSDDYIKSETIETLINLSLKYQADIVQGGFYYKYENYLLYDEFIIEKFDFNDLLYFRYLFIAKEGWNLRNEIAHGVLIPEQYTVELFNWVFFAFLRLAKYDFPTAERNRLVKNRKQRLLKL